MSALDLTEEEARHAYNLSLKFMEVAKGEVGIIACNGMMIAIAAALKQQIADSGQNPESMDNKVYLAHILSGMCATAMLGTFVEGYEPEMEEGDVMFKGEDSRDH